MPDSHASLVEPASAGQEAIGVWMDGSVWANAGGRKKKLVSNAEVATAQAPLRDGPSLTMCAPGRMISAV